MKTTLIAISLAVATTMAVTPAFAHCGGSHGKAYRTAQSKKPVASKEVAAKPAVPGVTAIAPANVVGQSGVVASTVQSAVDSSGRPSESQAARSKQASAGRRGFLTFLNLRAARAAPRRLFEGRAGQCFRGSLAWLVT
ncbi:MAG: hypothetical protein ACAH24_27480 [Hyphomicrobiaceae bacterium]